MEDIKSVLSRLRTTSAGDLAKKEQNPALSSIPDIFFDQILIQFKLSRSEIILLMYLYRQVWNRANMNAKYGIGPLQSFESMAQNLHLSIDEIIHLIHSLERFQLIYTVRTGQYFVRKFFTEEFDLKYGQLYDEFF